MTPAEAYRIVRINPYDLTANKLTWWLGKTRVSAITTFSRRPAAKTITSAMSSPVNGSTPLPTVNYILFFLTWHDLLVDSISLRLVSIESHNGELLITSISFISKTTTIGDDLPSQLDQGRFQ